MNRKILDALANLPAASLNYTEWINVGMALKDEGYDCSVWDEWSRNDRRYHDGECLMKWNSFRGNANPVAGGTIIQMAQEHGWQCFGDDGVMDWEDTIEDDGEMTVSSKAQIWHPADDLITYLSTLFDPDDYVSYITNDVWQDDAGRWVPSKGVCDRTASELIHAVQKHPDDLGAVLGDWKPGAGAWIRFNPVNGAGVKNENITKFRFALVESDTMSVEEQYAAYQKMKLPIACLVHSGGKSLHAIVRVDAPDATEYRKRVDFIYDFLSKRGVAVDTQNRNPSRLSRMPGVTRNGNRQYLVAHNIGRSSWADWLDYIEGVTDELPGVVSLSDYKDNLPVLPEELIKGILRQGHKMLISGSSKAGKSFLLMELCVAIAEGQNWLNFPCKKGRVLYVNLEIDPASCIMRFINIYKALGIIAEHMNDIIIWNLRGYAVPLDKLVPKLVRRAMDQQFDAIIVDPIYKVITGDENNASEMANFCNQFDRICTETGCATIYCHHHSKGAQGAKRAMDRASGSGVFARDPDAQLDMIQLELSDDLKNNVQDGNATAWRMESSLREFANIEPINFWFEYPIHRLDDSGELDRAHAEGSMEANFAKSSKRTTAEERKQTLDTAFDLCVEHGMSKIADMAEYMGINAKTIRRYIKENSDEYILENGMVAKKR